MRYSYDGGNQSNIAFLTELMKKTANDINETIEDPVGNKLNENQIKVGKALVELLTNWDELFAQMGSDKFNKSSILFYLKEQTLLNTKDIRDSMKNFKSMYYVLKKQMIAE
jgi:transcription initiation factor IIE alpha subunit